jgi:hypothetical protein
MSSIGFGRSRRSSMTGDQSGRRAAAALDRGSRRAPAPALAEDRRSRADARKLSSELDELFRLLGLDDLD